MKPTPHKPYNFKYNDKTTVMNLKEDAAERFT